MRFKYRNKDYFTIIDYGMCAMLAGCGGLMYHLSKGDTVLQALGFGAVCLAGWIAAKFYLSNEQDRKDEQDN